MNWLALDAFLTRIRPRRQPLALLIDAVVIVACWNATYLFRLGFERWLSARPAYDAGVIAFLVALYLVVFVVVGVPKGMWRFSGFGEIKRLTIACLIAGMLGATLVMLAQLSKVPRAVLALHPVVTLMGLTLARIGYRMLYEHMRSRIAGTAVETHRALVLGAGGAARRLIAGIQHEGWVIVGLLDDDPTKQGARISGVPVLGPLDSVAEHAERHGITHAIIAMPTATLAQRRRGIDLAMRARMPVLTVPGAQELQEGTRQRVRDIEPEDVLGRDPVQLDEAGIGEYLRDKVVLITGAGGSIGTELCRQVARYEPRRLVLFELNEFNLYTIEQDLAGRYPTLGIVPLIGDVKDLRHLRHVFARHTPQVVFHAAAYKHVPLMENENAGAALQNNTVGTYHAALAAAEHAAERFVLISTDKAVNPTNVMGATKRAAEMVMSSMAELHPRTRFVAVRFGNVLGSSGSVIPKFKEQIANGGPVTVTHPEIIRYFMTIPEAVRLVLQAAAIGESGQVLVLEMGEPVKIVELARQMIRLSGHTEEEIRIEFSGLRPGEKLYEELLADAEFAIPTPIPFLRIAKLEKRDGASESLRNLLGLESMALEDATVREALRCTVPEYRVAWVSAAALPASVPPSAGCATGGK